MFLSRFVPSKFLAQDFLLMRQDHILSRRDAGHYPYGSSATGYATVSSRSFLRSSSYQQQRDAAPSRRIERHGDAWRFCRTCGHRAEHLAISPDLALSCFEGQVEKRRKHLAIIQWSYLSAPSPSRDHVNFKLSKRGTLLSWLLPPV
eukprot:s459_g2.t1